MKQKPGKRIVSKAEYATRIIKKRGLHLGSFSLLLFSLTGFFVMMCCIVLGCMFVADYTRGWKNIVAGLSAFLLAFAIGELSLALWRATNRGIVAAGLIVPCVPLTRANARHLPVPDSLVRASQEPLQVQQSVLLRAAMETTEGPEEQWLRASAGEQKL